MIMIDKAQRLSYTQQAYALLQKLSLTEKVFMMSVNKNAKELLAEMQANAEKHYNYRPYPAGGLPEKNIPAMNFVDGPRGVVCDTGQTTCFPVSMLRGASFDTELEEKIGHAIGLETKAYGGNTFAGVCINLPYNPGWGRSQETYGEESFHLGKMGSALVTGVQAEAVIACVKHYAFNSMECSRFKVAIKMDKRTEREVFLPHFKDCVDAGAGSIMSAYNAYQGVPCGHSDYLLNQVLKKEWDFDGFVMSDFFWGIRDTVAAANGGQDIEMCTTEWFGNKLVEAVRNGQVLEETIDQATLRILRTLLAFEAERSKVPADQTVVGSKKHRQLALQSAREGITLLKNKEQVLPLVANRIRKIVVFGHLADKELTGDQGSSAVRPAYVITPLQGIANAFPKAEVIQYDGQDLEYAKQLATKADATIFVVGYNYDDEGEFVSKSEETNYTGARGGDRVNGLGLHADEVQLIKAVGPVNQNSTVVLVGGNTIMMTEWEAKVSAILMAYYPGMEGGTALGEIIAGQVNPSGKIPYVIPYAEADLPQVNWQTDQQVYDYYHGYAKLEKEGVVPLRPYGYGLSYTTFDISMVTFFKTEDQVKAQAIIKNTGNREGTEVVQLYVGFTNSKIDRPVKLLRGFQRVSLAPGAEKTIEISCLIDKLKWFNPELNEWQLEQMTYEMYLGTSAAKQDLMVGEITL